MNNTSTGAQLCEGRGGGDECCLAESQWRQNEYLKRQNLIRRAQQILNYGDT